MLGFASLGTATLYSCRGRSHARINKEQADLQNQSVRNQKECIHQLFGLTA